MAQSRIHAGAGRRFEPPKTAVSAGVRNQSVRSSERRSAGLEVMAARQSQAASQVRRIDEAQSAKDRAYIRDLAQDEWGFFDLVGPATGHLPFDNLITSGDRVVTKDIELEGGSAKVHAERIPGKLTMGRPRTSTTNIGGYLLSVMAAEHEGMIGRQEAITRLRQSVDTIQALPKYEGKVVGLDGFTYDVEHPYNWYELVDGKWKMEGDVEKISIVDNGNLALFMMGVIAALKDPARGALSKDELALIADLDDIVKKMRFDIAYNHETGLLSQVVEVKARKRYPSPAAYDMVISEGRNPYLAAIWGRQIPADSWKKMVAKYDRPELNVDPKLPFQSWTGTVFENLTTRLMVRHQGTPFEEADRQAMEAHIQEGIRIGGKLYCFSSESNAATVEGYAAYGSRRYGQHNKYSANVKGQTYKKLEVFVPHAAGMAILATPKVALEVLRNMEEIPSPDGEPVHMRGRFGFKESFTVHRNDAGEIDKLIPIDETFSHHKAWEFLAKCSNLSDNWIVERFHAEYDQDGLISRLLKTPARNYGSTKGKPSLLGVHHDGYVGPYETEVKYDPTQILGAGAIASLKAPSGTATVIGGSNLLSHGETFWLRDNRAGLLVPLEAEAALDLGGGKYYYDVQTPSGQKLGVTVATSFSPSDQLKYTTYDVRNRSDEALDLSLYTGFDFALARDLNAYMEARPHQSLRVVTHYDKATGGIVARRSDEPQEQDGHPFGFATLKVLDGEGSDLGPPDLVTTSRMSALGRLGGPKLPKAVLEGQTGRPREGFGVVEEATALLGKRFTLPPGRKVTGTLVLGATSTKAEIPALVKLEPPSVMETSKPQLPNDNVFAQMSQLKRQHDRAARMLTKPSRAIELPPSELFQFVEGGRKLRFDPLGTPKPWTRVLANEAGHCAVWTGAGGGYSAGRAVMKPEEGSEAILGSQAQRNRLTPWEPSLTSELPLRGVMVSENGESWSITSNPRPADDGKYLVEEGPGYIKYLCDSHGLAISMTVFCGADDPLEAWKIEVTNKRAPGAKGDARAKLELSSFVKWALSEHYPKNEGETETEYRDAEGAIFAHNPKSIFPEARAFHAVIGGDDHAESDRFSTPEDKFSGLAAHLEVAPGETRSLSYLLGQGKDQAEAEALVKKLSQPGAIDSDFQKMREKTENRLNNVQAHTPEPALDTMLNTWLVSQAYEAHFLGRTGFNQSGGAFGGRDQLQTVRALLSNGHPFFDKLARTYIIESCKHQFESGRAQAWWHPHDNYGQESIISDHALWLPFVIDEYLKATGDESILSEVAKFSRSSEELGTRRDFAQPMAYTKETATVFEHGRRAIAATVKAMKELKEKGGRGMPPLGGGDWNDGISRVGHLGRGESVWLGEFLCGALEGYAKIAERVGDGATASQFRQDAAELKTAINEKAWDKKKGCYAWAWDDDGDELGPIYSLTQAWAVKAGIASDEQAVQAMATAIKALYKKDSKIILLFDRAIDKAGKIGGKLYADPKGIRENGAQYTHGLTWLVEAVFSMGLGDLGWELLQCLLPTIHAADPKRGRHYGNEPNAVTADIYGGDESSDGTDTTGRGGWSWYTGAAGWEYSLINQAMLGVRRDGGSGLLIDPCIPHLWPSYTYDYRHGDSLYKIEIDNPEQVSKGVKKIEVFDDKGRVVERMEAPARGRIALKADGKTYRVKVTMGFVEGETNKATTVGLAEALKDSGLPVLHHLQRR